LLSAGSDLQLLHALIILSVYKEGSQCWVQTPLQQLAISSISTEKRIPSFHSVPTSKHGLPPKIRERALKPSLQRSQRRGTAAEPEGDSLLTFGHR
jgi:hypothetical protein